MPNETDLFLNETKEPNVMTDPLTPQVEIPTGEEGNELEDAEEAKNRRERRLQAKLTAEREANIAMAARLEALSEAKKFSSETDADYLKSIERIYGTDTPEAKTATELLKDAMRGLEKTATERALESFREAQRAEAQKLRDEERRLDGFVEEIEDSYGVNMTSDMQKGYFKMLEKMSPKDNDGNIVEYADPHSVWEVFSEKLQKGGSNRAKDLASRSMTASGASNNAKVVDDATLAFLKEQGII